MDKRWLLLMGVVAIGFLVRPAFAQSYSSPVAYCRAVGTIDRPDARYAGPKLPKWMARKLNLKASQGPQMEWRCANGAVMACVYGANIPCNSKADTSSQPSAEVADYCRENPDAPFIPAVVTGHESNISWACRGRQPYVTNSAPLDAQGYVKTYWRPVAP